MKPQMKSSSRARHALLAWLLSGAQALLLPGCHEKITGIGGSANAGNGNLIAGILGSNDLGVAMFNLYRAKLAKQPDPAIRASKLAALDGHRADFVKAINDIANAKSL